MGDMAKRCKLSLKRKNLDQICHPEKSVSNIDEAGDSMIKKCRNESNETHNYVTKFEENLHEICSKSEIKNVSDDLVLKKDSQDVIKSYKPLPRFDKNSFLENKVKVLTINSKSNIKNTAMVAGDKWIPLPPTDKTLWKQKPIDLTTFYGDFSRYENLDFDLPDKEILKEKLPVKNSTIHPFDINANDCTLYSTLQDSSSHHNMSNSKLSTYHNFDNANSTNISLTESNGNEMRKFATSHASKKEFHNCQQTSMAVPSTSGMNKKVNHPANKLTSSDSLNCCPVCHHQFSKSLSQMEIDHHLAECLSAFDEDITW